MVSKYSFLSVFFLGFEPCSSLRVHGKADSVLWGSSHSRKWVCGCVAGQRGALWSADGDYPSLWPGPTWLLSDLWLRLQSWSAQPSHFGTVFSQTLIAPEVRLWPKKQCCFLCKAVMLISVCYHDVQFVMEHTLNFYLEFWLLCLDLIVSLCTHWSL